MNHRIMAWRFGTGVEHKLDYTLCTNFVCESTSAYMVTMWNFDVISD